MANKEDVNLKHDIILGRVQYSLKPLVAMGYLLEIAEKPLSEKYPDTRVMSIQFIAPDGVDLSVIDGKFAISGKVLG